MCQLRLIFNSILLLALCFLACIITAIQYTIMYTLYIKHNLITFYINCIVSMIPSILIYLYLIYGCSFWGDNVANPLLPFVIIWKSFINPKSRMDKTRIYRRCNILPNRNMCYLVMSYILTYGIIITTMSILSQTVIIASVFILSMTTIIKAPKSYDVLILQIVHMIPNFFMYSAMLFTTSNQQQSWMILLMVSYWILSMSYLCIYVIFFASIKAPSDLIMTTELLLLFSCLYIALSIDYDSNHHILESISILNFS